MGSEAGRVVQTFAERKSMSEASVDRQSKSQCSAFNKLTREYDFQLWAEIEHHMSCVIA